MSDIKYIDSEADMIALLESKNEDVVINKNLSNEEKTSILNANNISLIKLYDNNENETGMLYVRGSYTYAPTGEAKLGVKLLTSDDDGDNITFGDSKYGVLSYNKNIYDAEKHALAILKSLGFEVDEDKLRETDFYYNYLTNVMSQFNHTSNNNIPLFYTNINGLKYYIGEDNYIKAVDWFREQGYLPYVTDETDDYTFDDKANTLRVTRADIPFEHMVATVVSEWFKNNTLDSDHNPPSTSSIFNAFTTMYNYIYENWGTVNMPSGRYEAGKKPNVFIVEINNDIITGDSVTLLLTALRIGEGDNKTISVFQPVTSPSYKKYQITEELIHDQHLDASERAIKTRWYFNDEKGWTTGAMADDFGGAYSKFTLVSTLNVGKRIFIDNKNISGLAGYNPPSNSYSLYEYANVNCSLGHSIIRTYGDMLTIPYDMKLPYSYEDTNNFITRTIPYDDNPAVDVDNDEPFKQPVIPVREEPINPTYIPEEGIEPVIDDTNKPAPTPPSPTPVDPTPVDPTPTPPIPPIVDVVDNGLFAVYNPTREQMRTFGGKLWSNNVIEILKTVWQNPMEGILSLQMIYVTPTTGAEQNIYCGVWNSNVSSKVVTNQFVELDCGGVNLFEHYGDARDYSPYTDVTLFLPFIGFVDLDVYEVMGGVVKVKYLVDVLTGCCLASVISLRDGVEKTLYTFNGNCSVQLPLTSADKSAIVTGAVSGAVSGAKTGMFAGKGISIKGAAIGGVLEGAIGGITAGVSVHRSGEMGANVGALGIKTPYLLVKRYVTFSASGYGGLLGYADNYRCTVGDVSGFCVFSNPIVDINATDTELNEIMEYLTTGIII